MRLAFLVWLLPVVAFAQTPAPRPAPAPKTAPAAGTSAPAAQTPKPAAPARPTTAVRRPATPAAAAPAPAVMTDEQKIVYAVGLLVQRSIARFDFDATELEIIKRSIADAAAGKPAVALDEWGPKVQDFARARSVRVTAKEKAVSAAFIDRAAAGTGATRTESGIVYTELTAGAGASPTAADTVRVHYRGTLTNGTEFDSSYARNEPAQFPLNGVIRCWTEGVQRMKVGGKSRLVCPSDLAYGDGGNDVIPGGAALIFEIELLDIGQPPSGN